MKILSSTRCNIGEAPIWNTQEQKLYFTNGFGGNEICIYDFQADSVSVRSLAFGVSAFVFDKENRLIVSHVGGVHLLREDGSIMPIYDNEKYSIRYANDMKVGPDGAIYVGTQSEKRKGISDKIDGKLYRISYKGEVEILLDNLMLSNGMEWSIDETKFYHTDSDTDIIKEYNFEVDDPEFEGIESLREVNKFKELDFDKDKVKELFDNVENGDDINKVFWFDNGNGIRSIVVETKFSERMVYNVFGQDDFEDVLSCFSKENVKSEPEVGFLKYGYR